MTYKIVGTTIKVQTDTGLIELESISGASKESREALDSFFQKWKILSIDTSIRQIPKISIPIEIQVKPKHKPKRAIGTDGFNPQERREIALSKIPEIFNIRDWINAFSKSNLSKEQIQAIKKNYGYDMKCLLAENKIIMSDNTEHIIKYQIIEKVNSKQEKEDAIKKTNEERKTYEGTFK